MNRDESRIPFRPEEYKNQLGEEFTLPYSLTEKESRNFPNLVDFGDLVFSGILENSGNLSTLTLFLKGTIHLKDVHDFQVKPFSIDDEVDLTLSPDDPENSDLLPEEEGSYDLKGSFLALLFDAIPSNFSTVPLKRVETPLFTLMSEDEYNATHKPSSDNGFSSLSEEDFPDQGEDMDEEEKKK
ncbi:MAG: hypothetical protein PUA93_06610 [Eubacteriales bacterium]|nr:hypothetical protein [Eubacteriales bacterium]